MQWPENFDFEATRAINRPAHGQEPDSPVEHSARGSIDEKKRGLTAVSLQHASEDDAADEEERELDPVALNKAFRLAAWASVILVRLQEETSTLWTISLTASFHACRRLSCS